MLDAVQKAADTFCDVDVALPSYSRQAQPRNIAA
jgi:hypothetical protein